jgi:vitamin B12 transporter
MSTPVLHGRHAIGKRGSLVLAVAAAAASICPTDAAHCEAVVVTGTRTPVRVDQALAEVTMLDRAAIEAAAGRTLVELLARESGLQFWANGGPGQAGAVSIRGLDQRHVLLIVDGVRYGSATLGTPVWDNFSLEAIDRIEIVRGPLSALYGSDAVGGVVQVFTRRGTGGSAAAGLGGSGMVSVGSNRTASGAAGLHFGDAHFDGAIGVQAQRTDGFSATNANEPFGSHDPDRDGFKQRSANFNLGFNLPGRWRLGVLALASRGEVQYDDGLLASGASPDARAKLRSDLASVQAGGPVVGGSAASAWHTTLRFARSVDEYDALQGNTDFFFTPGVIGTRQDQLAWENRVATAAGTLLVVAERLQQHVSKPAPDYDVTGRRITGVAIGLSGDAAAHHWQLAARHDANSQFGSRNTGTLGYGYDMTSELRLGASAGTSYVVPSFNQLYYPGFGSPTLQPEEGLHRELSLRYALGSQVTRFAWFDHRLRGYIPAGPRPANVPRAKIEGFSLAHEVELGVWTIAGSGDLLDARDTGTGAPLPRRAREAARFAVERRQGAFKVGATLVHVGERDGLSPYTSIDLRADWRAAPDWTLALRLNNAANRRYETVQGYNQAGREWYLALRYSPG